MDRYKIQRESDLVAIASALGANSIAGLSKGEKRLAASRAAPPRELISQIRELIQAGEDPLGDYFCAVRSAKDRRATGAVYTPDGIVASMLDWAENVGAPDRIVEPGVGSGRFLLEASRRFPKATLIGIENDPLPAFLARANLAAAGLAQRAKILVEDFREASIEPIKGRTLYIGNPPYVRHHLIDPEWKAWLKDEASEMGLKASALAGLHVYFFLAIARRAKAGDRGALITAAEWLDVNYGQLVRDLFLDRLGGQAVFVIEPAAEPFPGTAATGAITTFKVNGKPSSARFSRIADSSDLGELSGGRRVRRERLANEARWSHFTRSPREVPEGYIELGELCRVHRGQVTGANRIWIAGPHSEGLPEEVLFPTVTRAAEIIGAGITLEDPDPLKRVIDLPVNLDLFDGRKRDAINRFLKRAEKMGAKKSYIARHRKAWWAVGLREPAPILATYMARRPPAFVLNGADARHLNIAHGLYPRESFARATLKGLVSYLREAATLRGGRVYAGGLTKYEPREMERIPVPSPDMLNELAV